MRIMYLFKRLFIYMCIVQCAPYSFSLTQRVECIETLYRAATQRRRRKLFKTIENIGILCMKLHMACAHRRHTICHTPLYSRWYFFFFSQFFLLWSGGLGACALHLQLMMVCRTVILFIVIIPYRTKICLFQTVCSHDFAHTFFLSFRFVVSLLTEPIKKYACINILTRLLNWIVWSSCIGFGTRNAMINSWWMIYLCAEFGFFPFGFELHLILSQRLKNDEHTHTNIRSIGSKRNGLNPTEQNGLP